MMSSSGAIDKEAPPNGGSQNPPAITIEYLAKSLMETTISHANSMQEIRHMFSDLLGDVSEVRNEMAELGNDIAETKAEVKEIQRFLTKQFGKALMKQSENPSDSIHEMNVENTDENTGGKGTVRRENKAVHKTTTTNDKRLQSTLKRVGVRSVAAIEEVNIFKDDVVIQFINPQVQVSLAANTWVVSGTPQTKRLDNLDSLKKLEEQIQNPTPRDLARDLFIKTELAIKAYYIRERLKRRGL